MRIEIVEPATGEVREVLSGHRSAEVERRLSRCVQAQRAWARESLETRAALSRRVAALLEEMADDLAVRMATQMGKPVSEGVAEARKCAWVLRYYADHAPAWCADEPVDLDPQRAWVRSDPLGVILAIMPWNFPYWQVFRFAAPALMAGNGVVLKHALATMGIGLHIERLFAQAGYPDGLITAVLIDERETGRLIGEPRIAAVTLTGSERAGRSVAERAGQALKKCVLELGGSDPFVVLADADVKEAARQGARSRLLNAGQSCIAAKRFLVHEPIAEAFIEALQAELASVEPGDPIDPACAMGPLARKDLRDHLHDQVRRSVQAGARLVAGGRVPDRKGWYYPPTLLTGCHPGVPAFDEELFGPVAAVQRFADEAQAFDLAAATPYGLGASVWTRDLDRARPFIEGLPVGSVFVNGMTRSDPRLPFGGVKLSGYGRELGLDGLREWVNRKTIWVDPAHLASSGIE
ncbi:MAG: NAD-dependent succinate-semialdehyde dehydrogenase [Deltaproteobacteria bacterium]|nr:MAG: NAD-dependent succinate-semialdehyde dehydrogenase [Deltaproteobacteria bacterium]